MAGASYGVLGLLGGALLYGSARKRLSARWIMAIAVVGALSGLLLGRAATFHRGSTPISSSAGVSPSSSRRGGS
ncbi:MAG: hypothetical protein ACXVPP_00865 [Actinomycetota bacterium]